MGQTVAEPQLRHVAVADEGTDEAALGVVLPAGEQLFQALFDGDVGHLFDRARGELDGMAGRGLRLRLHLDPRDPRLRRLGHFPWERLRCPVTRSCLALDRRTPVVRCLDALQTTRVPPLAPPLRVLVVAASPRTADGLELGEEWRRIATALKRLDGVKLETLEHATRKSLRQRVREKAFHIVHFMGHGDFDEASAEGSLLLEGPDGQTDPISGDSLAALFSGPEKPNLIVLNACDTARATDQPDLDPFAGVAAALLLEGVPSVLAMAQPVDDGAAVELAEELYRRIVLGDPLEAAVVEARLALRTSDPDPESWAIPIHFVRPSAPDLPPVVVAAEKAAERPAAAAPAAPVFTSSIQAGHIGEVSQYQGQIRIENGKPVNR
ncbi:MAG TPA: CHAT domain-containing protein [Solirubrobacterales bacterium]|nr:CHAT domain-containing protein [Solirubrobacterales bacterium]